MTDIETIQLQLDRVLAFFPRVEARITGLFGVNTLILTICALNVSAEDLKLWYVSVPGALFVAALAPPTPTCSKPTFLMSEAAKAVSFILARFESEPKLDTAMKSSCAAMKNTATI